MLLVEDDKSLGTTLSERLRKEGFSVVWVETLALARKALSDDSFDLLILDVGLSDGSGFDLARDLKDTKSMPIIFVTAQSEAEDRLRGYELGAEEFIPKPFHLRELLLRVRHVLENHASTQVVTVGAVKIDLGAMRIENEKGAESLNQRETQVLKYLIDHAPKVVHRDELLEKIWGQNEFPSNRTVDNIIVRIRQALGESGSLWVRSVRGVGYQWLIDQNEGEK